MTAWSEMERTVQERATERCEYCKMHQSLQGATFHIEHILPRARGGRSELDNLALACPSCNLHKSDRVEVPAPDADELVPLFNPRVHNWDEHFRWDGYRIVGQTPIGRATLVALFLNHTRRIKIRQAEELFDLFPPINV